MIREEPGKVMPHQRHYQVGNIVRIRKGKTALRSPVYHKRRLTDMKRR